MGVASPRGLALDGAGGQALARYLLDNPQLVRGKRVLDLGSGGGKICYIASQVVGAAGRVIGVDMTTERTIVKILQELRSSGKTVVVVHHDLQTVPEYFDYVVLLNMRIVAHGPVGDVFTPENLHKTYGGRLTLLDEVSEAMRRRERSL